MAGTPSSLISRAGICPVKEARYVPTICDGNVELRGKDQRGDGGGARPSTQRADPLPHSQARAPSASAERG